LVLRQAAVSILCGCPVFGGYFIFAIGVHCDNREHQAEATNQRDPSLAQVMGVLFNVMFLDHLATDIERLERLNQLLGSGQISQSGIEGCEKMRPLTSFFITPSVDWSQLADTMLRKRSKQQGSA
jgi:hypothetical protein